MVSASSDRFSLRLSAQEQADLAKKFGRIPDGDIFDLSLPAVLKWGKPYWHIYQIIYARNARKDALTLEDNFNTWKALLFTLAETISYYHLPVRLRPVMSQKQWQRDLFHEAATQLWVLVCNAAGRDLGTKFTPWIAITRASRSCKLFHIPEDFNMELFKAIWVDRQYDVADVVAEKIDKEEEDRLLDRRVAIRLEWRLPETVCPTAARVYMAVSRGCQKTLRKHRWMLDLITVHQRLVRHAIRRKQEKAGTA